MCVVFPKRNVSSVNMGFFFELNIMSKDRFIFEVKTICVRLSSVFLQVDGGGEGGIRK